MLSSALLRASRSDRVRTIATSMPLTKRVVDRFVAGDKDVAALQATRELAASGLSVTIDRLGEDVQDRSQAEQTTAAYVALLGELGATGADAEVSVKLSALGQALPDGGGALALDNARRIAEAARDAGTTMTVDMEDHTTTDATLEAVRALRIDFPWVGTVLQSMLHRTEADCRDLATAGSRIRLVKGAYKEPATVAFQQKAEVDEAYERCLGILLRGAGYPMVATHDLHMIEVADRLIDGTGRAVDSYEFQMLYGIRPAEQRRLSAAGHRVRIYVPYGDDWYGYFMRRLAERPANVGFFLRALTSR